MGIGGILIICAVILGILAPLTKVAEAPWLLVFTALLVILAVFFFIVTFKTTDEDKKGTRLTVLLLVAIALSIASIVITINTDESTASTGRSSYSSTVSSGKSSDSSSDSGGSTSTGSSSSSGTSSGKKSSAGKSDPYNVYAYSDPEEFYYWQKDDFIDYEEAEDYWNAHHSN